MSWVVEKNLLQKLQTIPIKLVKLSIERGANCKGMSIKAHIIFHPTTVKVPGNSKANESANSTMSATHAASSSSVNRTEVTIRAFFPNET